MQLVLNSEQARALSHFFFDTARGLLLGGMGLSFTVSLEIKIGTILITSFTALVCIKLGLNFLEDINEY